MNVFIYELKQNKKSTMIWSVTFAVLTFALLSATPMFINESSAMKDMLASFPAEVKEAMGINLDTFFSAVGFYSYLFVYLGLTAAIQAMSLGLGIISKENRMKTADFLMSKPKRRASIYFQKLLSALCSLAITEAAFFIAAYISILYVSEGEISAVPFVLISLTFFFIQMIFFSLGLFLATLITKIKSPITITMGVTFGTFMLGMIGAIVSSMNGNDVLRYFSPFKYFDSNYIMNNNTYETEFVLLSVILVIVFLVSSFAVYVRKDIKSAT